MAVEDWLIVQKVNMTKLSSIIIKRLSLILKMLSLMTIEDWLIITKVNMIRP